MLVLFLRMVVIVRVNNLFPVNKNQEIADKDICTFLVSDS